MQNMGNVKVLIVDDLAPARLRLFDRLERVGYLVETAETGDDAMECIAASDPDVVLIGILKKEGLNRRELISQIKNGNNLPVISLVSDMADVLASGSDVCLPATTTLREVNIEIMAAIKKYRNGDSVNSMKKDQLSRSVVMAETNMRMILVTDAFDRIRKEEKKLFESEDIDSFYKIVVDQLMRLTEAQYGALALFNGIGKIEKFITLGMTDEQKNAIGDIPKGKGLLELVYKSDDIIKIDAIKPEREKSYLPPGHPEINSLLGSVVIINNERRAAIYLANKKHSSSNYSESDELVMSLFIPEIQHTLERNDLLNMLNIERFTLRQQRDEQQKLIKKIGAMRDQLVQSEKMASIGQLAAGVAHEINNPIGYVSSNFGTLKGYIKDILDIVNVYEQGENVYSDTAELTDKLSLVKEKVDLDYIKKDIIDLLDESNEGIDRVRKIVQDLKDFSHVDELEWQWSNVNNGINSTLNIVNNEIKYKAEVIKELGDLPEIECIASQLNQVFMNLFVNAAHAIKSRGAITIKTGVQGADWVYIEVIDNGSGIKAEDLKNIFNPFFTTKPVGQGTGLGLSLSYSIIQKHSGTIEVESKEGEGSRFIIRLPIRQSEQKAGNVANAAAK